MKLKNILIVLQDEKIWKQFLGKDIIAEKLEKLYPSIKYVTRLMTYSWGQKVIRFYDLDGNLIEVRTPM